MGMYLRTMWEVAEYFNTLRNPMTADEFIEFWTSLTDEECKEYLTAPLD